MTQTQKSPVGAGPVCETKSRVEYITAGAACEFLKAIQAALGRVNITPIGDGQVHRFRVPGDKPRTVNGWYVLFDDARPAGAFGSWRTGEYHTWSAAGQRMGALEAEEFRRKLDAAKQRREQEQAERNRQAAFEALQWWGRSRPADSNHPYLKAKHVQAHGLRQNGGILLVPLINAAGALVNLQRIYGNGKKLFLFGAQVSGAFALLGTIKPEGRLYICEGWATGAAIREHTGQPVACAMNCGNLLPVAKALRQKYPALEIIIAGDDDRNTEGNPGRTKANEAAAKSGALVTFPAFCRSDCSCTDFNDAHCCRINGGAQ